MPIEIKQFGGMVPKLDSESLPENAAELARNVSVHTGALVPVSAKPANLYGLNEVAVTDTEMTTMDKPSVPPKLVDFKWKCPKNETAGESPIKWLNIKAFYWINYNISGSVDCTITDIMRTPAGLILFVTIPQVTKTLGWVPSGLVTTVGPVFQFIYHGRVTINGDSVITNATYYGTEGDGGGPYESITFPPNTVMKTDAQLPKQRVPLEWGDLGYEDHHGEIYGYFEPLSYRGPDWNGSVAVPTESTNIVHTLSGSTNAIIEVNLNHIEPYYKTLHYVCADRINVAATAADTPDWHEGPPSKISEKVIVPPGALPKIEVPVSTTKMAEETRWQYDYGLYRREGGDGDFRLIEHFKPTGLPVNDKVQFLDKLDTPGDVLEPFGAKPTHLDTDEVYWHPSGFAVGYANDTVKKEYLLYCSDLYRPWAWPEENSTPLPEAIKAVVMSGNSAIVFTDNFVYAISGSDPSSMSRSLLSSAFPLIDAKSLARIGDTVYYSSYDGLVAVTGAGCKLISGQHFDRESWYAMGMTWVNTVPVATDTDEDYRVYTRAIPSGYTTTSLDMSTMEAKVGDGRLFYGPLVFDFEEDVAAVTTFNYTTAGDVHTFTPALWRSKVFSYPQPVTFDYLQILAEGTTAVTGRLYADGTNVATFSTAGGQLDAWKPVTYTSGSNTWARRWQVEIDVTTTVKKITLADRVVIEAQDVTVLTEEQVPAWKSIWLRWPHKGRWCAGALKQQDKRNVNITFTPKDKATATSTITTSGQTAFYLPRTMAEDSYWNVTVGSPHRFDELILWRRTKEPVEGVLRAVNDGSVPPWRVKTYVFPGEAFPGSITVQSGTVTSLTMNLYVNGSSTATQYTNVVPGVPVKLTSLGPVHELEVDFNGSDDSVSEILLSTSSAQSVGEEGLLLSATGEWVGQQFKFSDKGAWAIASAWFESSTATGTLKLYADGTPTATHSLAMTNGAPVYIPWDASKTGRIWEVELVSTSAVRRLELIPWTRRTLEGATLSLTTDGRSYPVWRHTIFQWADAHSFRSVWVDGTDEATKVALNLYLDDDVAVSKTWSYQVGVEQSMSYIGFPACRTFRFAFSDATESRVTHVRLHTFEPVQATAEGLSLVRPDSWTARQVLTDGSVQWACGVLQAESYANLRVTLGKGRTATATSIDVTESGVFEVPRSVGSYDDWYVGAYRTNPAGLSPRPPMPESLRLLPWANVPVEGGTVRAVRQDPTLPAWMYQRYTFVDAKQPRSILFNGTGTVTAYVYLDGSSTAAWSGMLTSGVEFPFLTVLAASSRVDFDFSDHDAVDEVLLFTVEEQVVGPEGLTMVNPLSTRMLPVKFPGGGAFAAVSVGVGSYPVTVTEYVGTTVVSTTTLSDGEAKGITRSTDYTSGTVDISGTDIRNVVLFPWRRQLVEGGLFDVRSEGGIAPWLHTYYGFTEPKQLVAFRVSADQVTNLKMVITSDAGSKTVSVVRGKDNAFSSTERGGVRGQWFRWYFTDGSGNRVDHKVHAVSLFAETVIPVGQDGLVLQQGQQVPCWRNVRLRLPDTGRFSVIRVVCDKSAKTTLYCGSTSVFSVTSSVADDYLIPALTTGRDFTLDIETEGRVDEVHLVGYVDTPVRQGSTVIRRQESPFTWRNRRVVSDIPVSFSCLRVVSSAYPVTVTFYSEDSTTKSFEATVQNDTPIRLPKKPPTRRWRIDINPASTIHVREVGIATSMERLKA